MGLDFGLINSVFDTSAGDINLRLKGLREEVSIEFTPNLTDGEIVIWLPPGEIYDIYNNVVDATKWDFNNVLNVSNSETTTYITMNANANGYRGILKADNLPAVIEISNIKFRITVDITTGGGSAFMNLGFLGNAITTGKYTLGSGSSGNWDDLYEARKKSNGDWDIYINNLYATTVTPTNSNIQFDMGGNAGGVGTGDIKIFEITIDGSAFLLASAGENTYRTPMEKI